MSIQSVIRALEKGTSKCLSRSLLPVLAHSMRPLKSGINRWRGLAPSVLNSMIGRVVI